MEKGAIVTVDDFGKSIATRWLVALGYLRPIEPFSVRMNKSTRSRRGYFEVLGLT